MVVEMRTRHTVCQRLGQPFEFDRLARRQRHFDELRHRQIANHVAFAKPRLK
jgi:hypothetical protein